MEIGLPRYIFDRPVPRRNNDAPPPGRLALSELLDVVSPTPDLGLRAIGWWGNGRLVVPIGRTQRPGEPLGDEVLLDFSSGSGHLLIVGRLGSGKSVLLCTIIGALALTHSPAEVLVYGLEAAGNRLGAMHALPHVRRVVAADQVKQVTGVLSEVEGFVATRRALFREEGIESLASYRTWRAGAAMAGQRDHQDVFLIIDGWQTFARRFADLPGRVAELASDGYPYGIHVLVSMRTWTDLPIELTHLLQSHIELRLDDPETSRVDPVQARLVPDESAGWGLYGRRRFSIALPRLDGGLSDPAATDLVRRVAAAWPDGGGTGKPRPVPQEPRLGEEVDLAALLGIADPHSVDVSDLWRRLSAETLLTVPIGVGQDGKPVRLDLKEPAQNGMGPHGLIVGATGSGKSELLRTLVLGLAATHSSEALNFLFIDFKGGATFATMVQLPHTSALVTNLADELALVDRMADAISGELTRRQEVLRQAGNYVSQRDYERSRAAGAPLAPLPSLLIVCDEFSGLLDARPDFLDLFVQIGRVGRSLGVHLLLASQRLEEGRIRGLETHLSYRIGLRTLSAKESRVVLGVPDAYDLPLSPGHGYLKFGTEPLTRFRAAYVSGVRQDRRGRAGGAPGDEGERSCRRGPRAGIPGLRDRPALPALRRRRVR